MSTYYFYDSSEGLPFTYQTVTRFISRLPHPCEPSSSPESYLEYAIRDYSEGSERGLINAFSNVKRSFRLMVDILMHQYGVYTHFRKSRFPKKLELLSSIDLLPIGILRNLNVERNLVEHEYTVPARHRVDEAIGVVKLLLLAARSLLHRTPCESVVGWRTPKRHALMQLEPHEGRLHIFGITAPGHYSRLNGINVIRRLRTMDSRLVSGIRIASKGAPINKSYNSAT